MWLDKEEDEPGRISQIEWKSTLSLFTNMYFITQHAHYDKKNITS